ncbi:MAG: class I SAM-dependent methyltransferase [Chloroflexi bacterium]|nr:class I SAM-dependent methyltransferase [Chloroflexota bacterium]
MDEALVQRLLAVNRNLYTTLAGSFAATRFREQPGYHRLLAFVPRRSVMLDLGCGNGRWATFLDGQGRQARYVGIDFSAEMIALARTQAESYDSVEARFVVADIAKPSWTKALPRSSFDTISALAVLHHLPGAACRAALVRQIHELLVPGGLFIFSVWQFTATERMRRKIVPWGVIGVDEQAVEPQDYLLDWHAGGHALRYCHLIDEQEAAALAADARFTLLQSFRSDGREGNLSLYVVLRK